MNHLTRTEGHKEVRPSGFYINHTAIRTHVHENLVRVEENKCNPSFKHSIKREAVYIIARRPIYR